MAEQNSCQPQPTGQDNLAAEQLLATVEQLQAELDVLRDQLAWSNRIGQLGMLTAALAHETNNFMTPVRTYAQLALANPDDPRLSELALRAAVEGTQKAEALTERILGLSTPNTPIQTGVCKADAAVTSAIQSMMPVIKQRDVHVLTRVEPVAIRIDELALEQVFINLIGNACQAMSGSQRRRQLFIESQRAGTLVVLSVGDNGPGVPPDIRDQLFEAFVTRGTSSQDAGSGLGLSICKQLIEAVGGQINLDSSSETGSTFRIELPAAS
ncbi:MAG: hypothetical protein KTR15_13645 [Phycisphaeraceae bacterium]|nr:hypothetical protein [Phycisphaeraceae bacterium]